MPSTPLDASTGSSGYHGLLPIYKPKNLVSKDVSRWLIRRFGKLKIGHVGTLDPMAEGVLPILLGKATRLQDMLLDMPKTYEFGVKFGVQTDTMDIEGADVKEAEVRICGDDEIQSAIQTFLGAQQQVPPVYSAVKYKGKALYEYGRANRAEEIPLNSLRRQVFIYDFQLLEYNGNHANFKVRCSKGTYVRVLANDLAAKLGNLGTVDFIKRTESSGISLSDTVTLETIESDLTNLAAHLIPIEKLQLADQWQWQCADEHAEKKLRMGQILRLDLQSFRQGFQMRSIDPLENINGSKSLTLFGMQGHLFGLGVALNTDTNYVQIQMKRELK